MVNGRKIVPEEKAPLNSKGRREFPFGPLAAGTDLNRKSMRNRE